MNHKRFAFFRVYGNAPVRFAVERMLREAFPEYEMDVYEVTALLKKSPGVIVRNGVEMLRAYGKDILQGHKSVRRAFWGTPYLFRQCQRLVQKEIAVQDNRYAFTFQFQSLVNANPGVSPHFVYTDHTHLANTTYKNYNARSLFTAAWVDEERRLYQNAARVFTWSSNISSSLQTQYNIPDEKVNCVYAGVNVPSGSGDNKNHYHSQNILFVGIDWERKGGPVLLQAFQQVRQKLPQARLTIIGASPKLDIENCEVVGLLPMEQVARYFEEATLFCLPTRLEPFGIVFIEAMSHQLPIVATKVGAIPDFVLDGENGYLIDPDDVTALTNSLVALLKDPQKCAAFGRRGYALFEERYNWKQVGKAIRRHVLEVL